MPAPAAAGGADGPEVGPQVRRWAARAVSFAHVLDDVAADVLPDPSLDRYARLVTAALGVPTALVTVVESDRQIFPGADGLPAAVEATRQTPLSHSFCKHVVHSRAPLVVPDARLDERVSDNPSIGELGVISYAGFPLTDASGTVIGSLCAIDDVRHDWTEQELAVLADLAAACSTEIALRELRRDSIRSAHHAYDVAHRVRVLLAVSERLARTRTKAEVARALLRVAIEELECAHAGLWVVDPEEPAILRYVRDPHLSWPQAELFAGLRLDATNPFGAAVLGGEPLFFSDRTSQNAVFPAVGGHDLPEDGQARYFLPLVVDGAPIGALVLLWPDQREFSDDDHLAIGALTASTATALQRATLLDDRVSVATKLQSVLLGELPVSDRVQLAARYRAAHLDDEVGGDWYDALVLPDGSVTVMIGDVVGHDIDAAATMGPLRQMLRTFAWDRDDAPAAGVERLDRAIRDLRPGALCTLVLARIDSDRDGRHRVRWTNAGHPAPVVLHADGTCESLDRPDIDCLLGVVPGRPRHGHEIVVEPGATLVLFTDGLIERRSEHLDEGRARLVDLLRAGRGRRLDVLLDQVVDDLVGDHPIDDVAVLAVRFR